jgi:hypothetical protein
MSKKPVRERTLKKERASPHTAVDWGPAFLRVFEERGNVRNACKAASISRSAVYQRLETDEAFKALFDEARENAADRLEDEAWRRGHDGVEQSIYSKDGELVGSRIEYSDTLLIVLLKANRPEKFKDKFLNEHKGELTVKMPDLESAITKIWGTGDAGSNQD